MTYERFQSLLRQLREYGALEVLRHDELRRREAKDCADAAEYELRAFAASRELK